MGQRCVNFQSFEGDSLSAIKESHVKPDHLRKALVLAFCTGYDQHNPTHRVPSPLGRKGIARKMVRSRRARYRIVPIARDGWRFTLPFLVLVLLFALIGLIKTAIFFLVVGAGIAAFFRDPDRAIPRDPSLILSPADGKVTMIDEVEVEIEKDRVERLRRVSIFLSIFNVHINRAPAYGTVISVKHTPGKYLNAMNDRSSEENESNMIWMKSNLGPLGIKQISGVIARRIVCYCRKGEHVLAGQRIGLIRFGSRTNAYFPLDATLRVSVGQKVHAGLTVLAEAATPPESLREEEAR